MRLPDLFGVRAAREALAESRAALEAAVARERQTAGVAERMAVRLATAKRELRSARESSGPSMSGGKFTIEANTALQGSTKWTNIRKMECDPRIDAALQGVKLPLVMAEWKFQPASDKPKDVEIADFCAAVLLHAPSEQYGREYWTLTPWKAQRIWEILSCLQNGFAAFHKSWKIVGDKKVYDRLTWLEPRTVDPSGWEISGSDDIVSLKRTFVDPAQTAHAWEPIVADDLALYPWNLLGARFEGTPWIRSMYGAWLRKDALLRNAVMWTWKIGNPPPMGFTPANYPADAKDAFDEFVSELRRSDDREDQYFTGPMSDDGKSPELKFAGSEFGEVDRVSGMINLENQEIAHPGAQKSQTLGETESGSRALGGVQQAREMQLYQAIADVVIEWEMYGVGNLRGVVEDLVTENFGDAQLPRLTVEGINPLESDAQLDRILKAHQYLPRVPAVTRKIATLAGFSVEDIPDEDLVQKAEEDKIPPASPDQGEGEEGVSKEDDDAADDSGKQESLSLAASPRASYWLTPTKEGRPQGGGFRFPNRLELEIVQLSAVQETFRVGEADLISVLKRINRQMIDDLNGRLESGKISRRNLDSQRRSKPRGLSRMRAEFGVEVEAIGMKGQAHAAEEIERAVKQGSLEASPKAKRVSGFKVAQKYLDEFVDEVLFTANLTVDKIWERLIREGLDEYARLTRQGFEGQELWDRFSSFMDGLSERPVEDLARQCSGVAYNQGRDMALMTGKDAGLVDIAVRSEVLDDRTCQYCQALDGTTYPIGSDDYYKFMPPAECEGGERCRGFYVVLPEAEIPNEYGGAG